MLKVAWTEWPGWPTALCSSDLSAQDPSPSSAHRLNPGVPTHYPMGMQFRLGIALPTSASTCQLGTWAEALGKKKGTLSGTKEPTRGVGKTSPVCVRITSTIRHALESSLSIGNGRLGVLKLNVHLQEKTSTGKVSSGFSALVARPGRGNAVWTRPERPLGPGATAGGAESQRERCDAF